MGPIDFSSMEKGKKYFFLVFSQWGQPTICLPIFLFCSAEEIHTVLEQREGE